MNNHLCELINYDLKKDIKDGQDVDAYSLNLAHFHQYLWTRMTPSGIKLNLVKSSSPRYEFFFNKKQRFSSDSMTNSYCLWNQNKQLPIKTKLIENLYEKYKEVDNTIAGFIIFPKNDNKFDRHWTINQTRGTCSTIKDRFDFTLECIRRWYAKEEGQNPLEEVLERQNYFYMLFNDFKGYIDFFFLQDFVDENYRVIIWSEKLFDPLPKTTYQWGELIKIMTELLKKRQNRIKHFICKNDLTT